MSAEQREGAALERLHGWIAREGGLLADALAATPAMAEEERSLDCFGTLVARGERASGQPDEYAMLIESILEGYLLHYGDGRILKPPDPDLRLLAGDFLYAFGLSRLASVGDLAAVDELADLISLCAQAHTPPTDGSTVSARRLTGAVWALSSLTVGCGGWPQQEEAKRRARSEGAEASESVLEVARLRAEELGLELYLRRALIGFDWAVGGKFSRT